MEGNLTPLLCLRSVAEVGRGSLLAVKSQKENEMRQKENEMRMFRNKPAVEIDIENCPVLSIDRRGSDTIIRFKDDSLKADYLRCSLDDHNRLVDRFRHKLGLTANSGGSETAGPEGAEPYLPNT